MATRRGPYPCLAICEARHFMVAPGRPSIHALKFQLGCLRRSLYCLTCDNKDREPPAKTAWQACDFCLTLRVGNCIMDHAAFMNYAMARYCHPAERRAEIVTAMFENVEHFCAGVVPNGQPNLCSSCWRYLAACLYRGNDLPNDGEANWRAEAGGATRAGSAWTWMWVTALVAMHATCR